VVGAPATGVGGGKKRRPQRRGQILKAAVELFYERGYAATGIHDIGAAAGITGPAIYRHFESKEEILAAAVREYAEVAIEGITQVVESPAPPEQILERLAENLIDMLLDHLPLAAVYTAERRMLSEPAKAQADRLARLYLEEWVHVISRVRPDLSDGEARLMANGIMHLGMSLTVLASGIPRERVSALMQKMIIGAVEGPAISS